ncbi:hypothetical protein AB0O34_21435 [Sphaerisporangium sp. NPDC088356]|uniref:hypothetical protein n=1 Tax=Sphaerisporangium sp. NPDC088356 TaxID=3154871 RepID=UPI00342C3492
MYAVELAYKPPERWQDEVVGHGSEQLTAAEISRLAGVTRATVSNWRRRHPDFSQPSGGTEASPTYDRDAVESWLAARGQLPEASPLDELRAELRKLPRDVVTEGVPAVVRAALRMDAAECGKPAGAKAATWRTATVADLVRGGAIDLHRARPGRDKQPTGHDAPSEHDDTPVLTAGDVTASRGASGSVPASHLAESVEIRRGDVLLPEMLHGASSTARVADQGDAGAFLGPHLHLFRPDLDRLDPWFLAGFLSAEDNLNSTATGSTIVRVDARRLRVPLLPLEEQRRYGKAFRRMAAL